MPEISIVEKEHQEWALVEWEGERSGLHTPKELRELGEEGMVDEEKAKEVSQAILDNKN